VTTPPSPDWGPTMARYNRWMNERLYALCAELPDAERKRDRGAFFRSVHGTLNHLCVADHIWLGRFVGVPRAFPSLDHELHADFAALRAERAALDERIDAYVAGLTPAALGQDLVYTSMVDPAPRRLPLWAALTHFFNHQTHHRGQLTTLLSQSGVDPGVTDLLWLPGVQRPGR
jgi:uncharacterized damage-inducible protein DinB